MNHDLIQNTFEVRLVDTETNEVIGTTTTLQGANSTYVSSNPKHEYNFNRSYSATLENASINYDTLLNLFPSEDQMFTVVCSTKLLNKLKYIQKHTKKKRIKNKISKRIVKEFSHPVFNEGVPVRSSNIKFK